jgi:hypothetical protein
MSPDRLRASRFSRPSVDESFVSVSARRREPVSTSTFWVWVERTTSAGSFSPKRTEAVPGLRSSRSTPRAKDADP